MSIKLLYGLYRLGTLTSPIPSKQLYGSLQVLHSLELNQAFDHIKPSTADESTNFPWDWYWFISSIVIYSSPEWKGINILYLRARFLVGAWFSRLGRQKKRFCPQLAFWTTVQGGKWALIILSTSSSKLVIYRQERRLALSSWARIHFLLMSPISCLKYSIFQVVSWNSPILYFWL